MPQLIADLSDPNFTIRMLAMNYLADVTGPAAVEPLKTALSSGATPTLKAHGMWILHRLGALDEAMLRSFAGDSDRLVRVHAMRVLSETPNWSSALRGPALAGLHDADPVVQRCAAEALGQHPQLENVRPLLDARQAAPLEDKHLVHAMRIALRNQLNDNGISGQLPLPGWSDRDTKDLVDVAAGATSPGSTLLLIRQIGAAPVDALKLADAFRHAGRYGTDANADELAEVAGRKFADDESAQLSLFGALLEGIQQRGGTLGSPARAWGGSLANRLLTKPAGTSAAWTGLTLAGGVPGRDVWAVETRKSADGVSAPFLSSLPPGETGTGVIRSQPFTVPAHLTFYMAGHNGQPPAKHPIKNIVRLRSVEGDVVLAEAPPPRNDVAQKITWDLGKFEGKQGYFEATDGDDARAYAWLAFGRFDPAVVKIPAITEMHRLRTAVDIAAAMRMKELEPRVAAVLVDPAADPAARLAAAKALPELNSEPTAREKELLALLTDTTTADALRIGVAAALQQNTSDAALSGFVQAIRAAPQKLQLSLATSLAASARGGDALLEAVRTGKASPRLLQDPNVHERLNVSKPADLEARLAKLTANLPAADVTVQALIDDRVRSFDRATSSPERGQKVFQQTCVACHSIGGVGARVGPQLDGIGLRGVPRLAEDILDPSRNVDEAFRYSTYVLQNGDVVAGILRRDEGETIIVADSTGKEISIANHDIKRVVPSTLSLMPGNFGEVLKVGDFNDLMSYLLAQQAK